jgi:hypothetical protein
MIGIITPQVIKKFTVLKGFLPDISCINYCVHFKVSRERGIGPTCITFFGILVEEFTSILL